MTLYRVYDKDGDLLYEGSDWNVASRTMRRKGGVELYSMDDPGPKTLVTVFQNEIPTIDLSNFIRAINPDEVPIVRLYGLNDVPTLIISKETYDELKAENEQTDTD